jgi:hypothetical protein
MDLDDSTTCGYSDFEVDLESHHVSLSRYIQGIHEDTSLRQPGNSIFNLSTDTFIPVYLWL